MNPIKPGIQTSELYVTLATMLIAPLVAKNILPQTSADTVVNAIVILLGLIMPPIVYTVSRTWLKGTTK